MKITFKETEIGMIPEDWEVRSITQLGEVITGKTPKTNDNANFGKDCQFITPRDMKGQKHTHETERYLSEKGKNSVKNSLIPKNSICISCIGSDMGKITMTTDESVTNQQIHSIITKISADFIYYAMLNISQHIKNLGKQSTAIPILNKTQFSKISIPLPSDTLEIEQIAKTLSDLDSKIELNQQMNKTLEAIGKAIFKHWFVDFEFPNENGKPYKSSGGEMIYNKELGKEIPNGWSVKSLYNCAQFINGDAFRDTDFSLDEEGLPIIKIFELKYGIAPQTNFTNKIVESKYLIDNEEILFAWSGSPDTSIDTFIWTKGKAILNQHIFKVIEYDPIEKTFIYFLLKYLKKVFVEIARNKQTTGLGHVTIDNMKHLLVIVPNNDIMKKFNNITNPIFSKMCHNSVNSHASMYLRDSLLPKLMSGKIRIPAVAN